MTAVIAGVGLTYKQLAEKAGLSPGGASYVMEEWKAKPSYAARLIEHERRCVATARTGVRCTAFKGTGKELCHGHERAVGKALASLL